MPSTIEYRDKIMRQSVVVLISCMFVLTLIKHHKEALYNYVVILLFLPLKFYFIMSLRNFSSVIFRRDRYLLIVFDIIGILHWYGHVFSEMHNKDQTGYDQVRINGKHDLLLHCAASIFTFFAYQIIENDLYTVFRLKFGWKSQLLHKSLPIVAIVNIYNTQNSSTALWMALSSAPNLIQLFLQAQISLAIFRYSSFYTVYKHDRTALENAEKNIVIVKETDDLLGIIFVFVCPFT